MISLLAGVEKNRRYDLQTAAVIRRVVGPTALGVDVGAHTGDILRHLVAAAPAIPHLAIEPLPHLADALRSRFPTAVVHQSALVAEPSGPVEFHHVTSNPAYSGILERRYDRPNETVEQISVPTARLDDLCTTAPSFIKIDVEGAELGVLRGASRVIGDHRPVVVFEHGLGASDRYGTTPEDVFDYFADRAMTVNLLATWLEDGPALSRDQFCEQFHAGVNFYFLAAPD